MPSKSGSKTVFAELLSKVRIAAYARIGAHGIEALCPAVQQGPQQEQQTLPFDRSSHALLIFFRRDYHLKKDEKKFIVSERLKDKNRVQTAIDENDKYTILGKNTLSAPALKKAKSSQRRNTVKTIS